MNPLLELQKLGQSVWLDFITRRFMTEGKLQKLISEDGLSGETSNPTIFQKAIEGGTGYDATIERFLKQDQSAPEIFESLAIEDIQRACDLFRPVFDKRQGADGFVSIEVNPHSAHDARETVEEARRLWTRVARPNLMVKIPATPEGLPAIEQLLGEGLNINITLIFSLERYRQVIEAWLAGLEHLAGRGQVLAQAASVASFFVSRVDTLVDGQLEKKIASASGEPRKRLEALLGKAAIANAKEAYRIFQNVIQSGRFKALQAKGARVQRPLWASTSTKNPRYRDVLYVEELIGADTVNTLPLQTIDAFRDHGRVRPSLTENPAESAQALASLRESGIDMKQVTQQLEDDGVRLFAESYDNLIQSIERKRKALKVAH